MVKIIEISNCHIFDNTEITEKQFWKLCEVLSLSCCRHTIKLIRDGQESVMIVNSGLNNE